VSLRSQPIVRGGTGVVACGHPLAASAAIALFRAGGGAMDAAVGAAAALAVLLPDACGLGGDALMLVRTPDGVVEAFNGSGAAPASLELPVPTDGAGSAAVPGAVAAWEVAQRRFGRLPLSAVLAPAIALARNGYPVGERLLAAVEAQRPRLERGAPGWGLLDRTLVPGARFRQPELAELLTRIADEGSTAFYTGWIAEAIVRVALAEGGRLAVTDLASHRTVERSPVLCRYRGAQLAFQPPVSQAILAPMALGELERRGVEEETERLHLAIEAVEAAFAYRDEIAVPDKEQRLLSTRLALDHARAGRRGGPRAHAHTTAVAAADADGTVVSQLVSVFDDFGSAALVPEGGFLLNDRLTGFSDEPGSPNAPAPGRKPVHTLSPALIDDGRRVFALATPGADGQVQVLVQLIEAIVREGRAFPEALEAPRWRSVDGRLAIEEGFDPARARALAERGHELWWLPAGDSLFGACAVAGFDRETGKLLAAADPRREVSAAAW
jgi:gamma-glutamyltranspeptidase / glutathione hydrolase